MQTVETTTSMNPILLPLEDMEEVMVEVVEPLVHGIAEVTLAEVTEVENNKP